MKAVYLKVFVFLIVVLAANYTFSQHSCGFDHLHQEMLQTDTAYQKRLVRYEKQINKLLTSGELINKSSTVYSIPVVVHVIYAEKDAEHNISDAQIQSGIQRLNDIFNNSDGTSVNANIEFCLATRSPSCEPTNGINRIDGSVVQDYATEGIDIESNDTDGKGADRISILNLSRWNTAEYLNIWIVNEISNNNGGSGIQAFATLPGSHFLYDGVVALYNTFGYDYENCDCYALKSYTDENEVIAHEVGHFLNLYHTFEGDSGGTGCPDTSDDAGDKVADTPAHIRTYSCVSGSNSCYSAGHAFSNMGSVIHNYMGYSPESCQYEFTQGQIDRMRATLETSRYALAHSSGCSEIPLAVNEIDCKPQTEAGIYGEYGMGIINVKVGDLISGSGSSFQDGGYVENWCNQTTLQLDTEYEVDVQTYGFYNEDLRIYIDYDNSGGFSDDEKIFSSNNNSSHTGVFTTPSEAVTGQPLRMRIISDHFQYNIDNACYAPAYGQIEDYSIQFPVPDYSIYERGKAIKLDGEDDYLMTNYSNELTTDEYTIEFWVKPEGDVSVCQLLFDKTVNNFSSLHFMAIWHGRMFIYHGKDLLFLNPQLKIKNDVWQHLAYTWDGQVHNLYLNGTHAGTDTISNALPNDASFKFGSFFGVHFFFEGQMDEIRIWPYVKTGQQIRENMFLTESSTVSEDVVYFNFNQDSNGSLLTGINNNYNLVLDGNPSFENSTVNVGYSGTSETKSIGGEGAYDFSETGTIIKMNQVSCNADFTITKEEFELNSLMGIASSYDTSLDSWSITSSDLCEFDADITFTFNPTNVNTTLQDYKLFHRATGDDGMWNLLINEATSLSDNTITFSGISQTGQFKLVGPQ